MGRRDGQVEDDFNIRFSQQRLDREDMRHLKLVRPCPRALQVDVRDGGDLDLSESGKIFQIDFANMTAADQAQFYAH
jgi:hypothetical protein